MANPELYLNLNYNQKVLFAIVIIMIIFIISIITKIKNNKKTKQIRQTNQKNNTLKIDYEEFIKSNFKKTEFLFENKVRLNELIKLIG